MLCKELALKARHFQRYVCINNGEAVSDELTVLHRCQRQRVSRAMYVGAVMSFTTVQQRRVPRNLFLL